MTNKDDYMDELPSLDRTTTFGLGSAFLAASMVLYGDASLMAFGHDLAAWLSTSLHSFGAEGAIEVTYAHGIAVLSIVGAYVGNNAELGEFSDHQSAAGYLLIGSVVLPMLSGEVSGLITESYTRAAAYVGAQAILYVSMVEAKEMADRGWA